MKTEGASMAEGGTKNAEACRTGRGVLPMFRILHSAFGLYP
jgi:hypothetical protein